MGPHPAGHSGEEGGEMSPDPAHGQPPAHGSAPPPGLGPEAHVMVGNADLFVNWARKSIAIAGRAS